MNATIWFLVFFIPAYVANMTPVFVRKLPVLAYPLDAGLRWRGQRLLGANKTVRGIVFGTLAGGLAGYMLVLLGLPYTGWWGFLIGLAALLGDAFKSFFKRRIGIRPGGRWVPFDQLDFLVVAFLCSLALTRFPWWATLGGFAIIFCGTVLVQLIGGWTRLKADSL